MKTSLVILTFTFVMHQNIPKCETRLTCRQKVHNTMEFLKCPPPGDQNKELKYCCLNNGITMSCCNYNDYRARHEGPSAKTICFVIIFEMVIVGIAIWWCCRCVQR